MAIFRQVRQAPFFSFVSFTIRMNVHFGHKRLNEVFRLKRVHPDVCRSLSVCL